jgi:uncharacterized protein YkwD
MNLSTHSFFPRRIALLLVLSLAVAVLALGGAQAGSSIARQQKPQPAITAADLGQRIHAQINEQRARHGLGTLSWNASLARIAARHSHDMADRNYFSHDTPEGRSFGDRYRQAGFSCQVRIGHEIYGGAENIALGRLYNSGTIENGVEYYNWNSAEQIARMTVDGWMHSPGHRKNILTPYWRREGIGVEVRPDNKVYITQNFC